MYNPENQEKHLAPMDVKIRNKTTVMTIVAAIAVILGVFILAEIVDRVLSSLQGM